MKQRVYVSTYMFIHLWGRWYVDMVDLIEEFSFQMCLEDVKVGPQLLQI